MHPLKLAVLRLLRGGTGLGLLVAVVSTVTWGILLVDIYQVGLQRAAMRSSIAALEPADRTVSASFDGPSDRLGPAQVAASETVARLSGTPDVESAVASRPMWDGTRTTVQLAAVSEVSAHVSLESGRLPTQCSPTLCEAVIVGDADPELDIFNMVVVGRGNIIESSPLLQLLDPAATTVIAGDPAVVRDIRQVAAMGSSVVWSAPLSPPAIADLSPSWLADAQRRSSALSLVDSHLVLRVPDSEIRQAVQQSGAAARRLEGLGIALSLLAVGTTWRTVALRRRDIEAVALISAQLGRPAHKYVGVTTVATAVALGLFVGAVAAPGVALLADLPLPRGRAWAMACVASLACLAVATSRLSQRLWVAAGTAAVCGAGLSYAWSPTTSSLAVPAAACGAAALAMAIGPFATTAWRSTMTRVHSANLARPLAAAVAVCGFATATITAATTQGSALSANAQDQATFAAPLAIRLTALTSSPLANGDRADFESATGAAAYPVLRLPATARAGSLAAATVQVVGVDTAALTSMRNVARQTGADATDYQRLRTDVSLPMGPSIDTGAPVRVQASGLDTHSDLLVWMYDGEGSARASTCAWTATRECVASVPGGWSSASLIGFTVQEDPNSRARREHAAGEGAHAVEAPRGTLVIASVNDARGPVPIGSPIALTYDLSRGPAYHPLIAAPASVPALVDGDSAATAPLLLTLRPTVDLAITPIGTMRRFPTAPARFAVIDFTALAAALAALDPTLLSASEVWLDHDVTDESPLLAGVTLVRQSDVATSLDGSAARKWTSTATATTGALMLIVIALAAAALARHTATALPFRTWRLLGTRRRDYLIGALRATGRQVALVCLLSATAATAIANTLVQSSNVDVMGRVAAPPVATVWPWLSVVGCAAVAAGTFFAIFAFTLARATERSH